MELLILRNPDVAEDGICLGQSEANLKPTWLSKMPQLQTRLPKFARTYTSPVQRCVVLAGFLGGQNVRVDERLHEQDFGRWEGRPWRALPARERQQWLDDPENATPHDGETGEALLNRAEDFLSELLDTTENALVVADAGWIRAILGILLGTDMTHTFRLDIDPLHLTQIGFNQSGVCIRGINQKLTT